MCRNLAIRLEAQDDAMTIERTSLAREGQLIALGNKGWWRLESGGCSCAFLGDYGLSTTVLARVCELARRKDIQAVELQWWGQDDEQGDLFQVSLTVDEFRSATIKGKLAENTCYRITAAEPVEAPGKLNLLD